MNTYLVEFDPLRGEPNGYYVNMTAGEESDLRALFKTLQARKSLREWRIEDVESLGISYREFSSEIEGLASPLRQS